MLIMLLSARHFFTVCRSGMNIAACRIIKKTSNPLPLLFLVWEKQTLCWDSKPEPNSNAQTLFRIGALGWLLFIMVLCSFQTSLCSFVCCIFVARQLVYYIWVTVSKIQLPWSNPCTPWILRNLQSLQIHWL